MERTFRVVIDVVIEDDEDFKETVKEYGNIEDYITGEMQWCNDSFDRYKIISMKESKMKKTFTLNLVSKHTEVATLEIEAKSIKEAKKLFKDGDFDMEKIDIDDSCTQPDWDIEDINQG